MPWGRVVCDQTLALHYSVGLRVKVSKNESCVRLFLSLLEVVALGHKCFGLSGLPLVDAPIRISGFFLTHRGLMLLCCDHGRFAWSAWAEGMSISNCFHLSMK